MKDGNHDQMEKMKLNQIESISEEGRVFLDLLHLKDGTVIGVSVDSVCLYKSEESFYGGEFPIASFERPSKNEGGTHEI